MFVVLGIRFPNVIFVLVVIYTSYIIKTQQNKRRTYYKIRFFQIFKIKVMQQLTVLHRLKMKII